MTGKNKEMPVKKRFLKLPHIGMRLYKSAIGVFLCFLIYLIRGKQGTPFYSAIAVLWCIQNDTRHTWDNARQRIFGTAVGAVYGLIYILCKLYVIDLGDSIWHYLCLSCMAIPVIYTATRLQRKNAAYFSCVVFFSITVNHLMDANPYLFVLNRALDTLIGILVGLAVNSAHLPTKKRMDTLYVADLDNALRDGHGKLDAYSRITLNTLLEEGLQFSIMTLNTPAAYLEAMSDINLNLPIIAMDGAVLYDTRENSYKKQYVISPGAAQELEQFIIQRGFNLFSNVILEDLLIIYYGDLKNPAEQKLHEKFHRSPYRNYLHKERPKNHPVVYFMLLDETERADGLYQELCREGYQDQFKILLYPSEDDPEYSFLKIYNANATAENMIDYLLKETHLNRLITVSDEHSRHGVMYAHHDSNHIVRMIRRSFLYGGEIRNKTILRK